MDAEGSERMHEILQPPEGEPGVKGTSTQGLKDKGVILQSKDYRETGWG